MKSAAKLRTSCSATAGILLISLSANAFAEGSADLGKIEYESACAACHGLNGKGDDSVLKSELVKQVPDLTELSRQNNGVFPFESVYQIIDGRKEIKTHGSRDMPIWGAAFKSQASVYFDRMSPFNSESIIRSRILALTEYLHRLQVK